MTARRDSKLHDRFEGPGFTAERHGRELRLRSHRSAEEQRELIQRMRDGKPNILASIQSHTDEFLAIVHKYTSLDLVANLMLFDVMHDPNTYQESDSKLRPHWVEHAAALELKDPQYELRRPVLVEAADIERARELLGTIFDETVWYYLADNATKNDSVPPSRMDQLRFLTLIHGMSVRSPAYASHWRDVLLGLFEQKKAVDRVLTKHSLSVQNALAIIDAIEKHIIGSLQSRIEQARNTQRDWSRRARDYRKTGVFEGKPEEKELFERFRNMRSKDAKQYIKSSLLAWVRVAMGTVLSFTAETIAQLSGVPLQSVEALLSHISIEFGATKADYYLPAPVNIFHERPIIRYDENYFCPAPHLLPWTVKPVFERILNGSPEWNTYQKQRASYLIDMSLKCLSNMLPGCTTYKGLFYPLNFGAEAELDALVVFDRCALLIEGKAGSFGTARRAGPLKIKTQLEGLVGDAVDQVLRADEYIQRLDKPTFRLESGGTVVLDKAKFSECLPICVSLDALDIFTAEMHQMRDIGITSAPTLPWFVALTDLRAISEVFIRSFEFIHYLKWRLSLLGDSGVEAKDELRRLGVYIHEGPSKPTTPSGYTHHSFVGYLDDLDAYFLYKEGLRSLPAPRPAQPLPSPIDSLFDALQAQAPYGFTQVGELLLNLSFSERTQLAEGLKRLAFSDSKGRISDVVLNGSALVAKVTARKLSTTELTTEANAIHEQSAKSALVIRVTTKPNWQVNEWATVS